MAKVPRRTSRVASAQLGASLLLCIMVAAAAATLRLGHSFEFALTQQTRVAPLQQHTGTPALGHRVQAAVTAAAARLPDAAKAVSRGASAVDLGTVTPEKLASALPTFGGEHHAHLKFRIEGSPDARLGHYLPEIETLELLIEHMKEGALDTSNLNVHW